MRASNVFIFGTHRDDSLKIKLKQYIRVNFAMNLARDASFFMYSPVILAKKNVFIWF